MTSKAYTLTQSPKRVYVDFENGPAFRALAVNAWGRKYWVIEEWDNLKGVYNYSGKERTANDAIQAIILDNQ